MHPQKWPSLPRHGLVKVLDFKERILEDGRLGRKNKTLQHLDKEQVTYKGKTSYHQILTGTLYGKNIKNKKSSNIFKIFKTCKPKILSKSELEAQKAQPILKTCVRTHPKPFLEHLLENEFQIIKKTRGINQHKD